MKHSAIYAVLFVAIFIFIISSCMTTIESKYPHRDSEYGYKELVDEWIKLEKDLKEARKNNLPTDKLEKALRDNAEKRHKVLQRLNQRSNPSTD